MTDQDKEKTYTLDQIKEFADRFGISCTTVEDWFIYRKMDQNGEEESKEDNDPFKYSAL